MQDLMELLEWAKTESKVAVAVSVRTGGEVVVQAEGPLVPTVYAHMGDTLTWDGVVFKVESPEPAPAPPPAGKKSGSKVPHTDLNAEVVA
jgi:hypothetical protein